MTLHRHAFVYREGVEPHGYLIYADDTWSYVLCDECVTEPRNREFPIYADEANEPIRCNNCERIIMEKGGTVVKRTLLTIEQTDNHHFLIRGDDGSVRGQADIERVLADVAAYYGYDGTVSIDYTDGPDKKAVMSSAHGEA